MRNFRLLREALAIAFAILCLVVLPWDRVAVAAEVPAFKTADGLTVYIGVMPAEIVKGHPSGHTEQTMHGGVPKGSDEYHVVTALFDAATGARVSDATVTAQISGVGLSGTKKKLDSMEIANTISYGGFFDLPGRDIYTITLTIQRPNQPKSVTLDFKYDHRQ
jgi:hypothetical protein